MPRLHAAIGDAYAASAAAAASLELPSLQRQVAWMSEFGPLNGTARACCVLLPFQQPLTCFGSPSCSWPCLLRSSQAVP